jgi:hypothetical protein
MRSIGIRVSTSEIFYSIFEIAADGIKLITHEKINEPAAYTFPQTLTYYRKHLESIVKEYNVSKCGIKIAEPMAGRMGQAATEGSKKRLQIEGVMIETINSIGLELIYGPFATFAPLVKIKKSSDFLNVTDFFGIPNWTKTNKNFKESTLAGVGVLQ